MPSEARPGPREFADRLRGFGFRVYLLHSSSVRSSREPFLGASLDVSAAGAVDKMMLVFDSDLGCRVYCHSGAALVRPRPEEVSGDRVRHIIRHKCRRGSRNQTGSMQGPTGIHVHFPSRLCTKYYSKNSFASDSQV